jgi:hypothetical protein
MRVRVGRRVSQGTGGSMSERNLKAEIDKAFNHLCVVHKAFMRLRKSAQAGGPVVGATEEAYELAKDRLLLLFDEAAKTMTLTESGETWRVRVTIQCDDGDRRVANVAFTGANAELRARAMAVDVLAKPVRERLLVSIVKE